MWEFAASGCGEPRGNCGHISSSLPHARSGAAFTPPCLEPCATCFLMQVHSVLPVLFKPHVQVDSLILLVWPEDTTFVHAGVTNSTNHNFVSRTPDYQGTIEAQSRLSSNALTYHPWVLELLEIYISGTDQQLQAPRFIILHGRDPKINQFSIELFQVKALCDLKCGGVPATYISSQQSETDKKAVFRELAKRHPSCKLLYITPEQFVKGGTLQRILMDLDSRGLLARIVVDEVNSSPSCCTYKISCYIIFLTFLLEWLECLNIQSREAACVTRALHCSSVGKTWVDWMPFYDAPDVLSLSDCLCVANAGSLCKHVGPWFSLGLQRAGQSEGSFHFKDVVGKKLPPAGKQIG